MYAGGRGLSCREQPAETGSATEVGTHAAHCIVSGRAHRSGSLFQIDAIGETSLIDARKALTDETGGEVSEIKEGTGITGDAQLHENRAGHDVARGKFFHGMVALQEAFTATICQV